MLSHLLLFTYIYPGEARRIPSDLVATLLARWARDGGTQQGADNVCRGGLLSRAQFVVDFADRGYQDERIRRGNLTAEQLKTWTNAAPDVPRVARRKAETRCVSTGGKNDADLRTPVSPSRAR